MYTLNLFKNIFLTSIILTMTTPSFLLAEVSTSTQNEKFLERNFIKGIIHLSIGGNSGGGGDDIGMNFHKTINDAIENMRTQMPKEYQIINKNNIENIVSKVKIIVVDENLDVRHKGYIQNSVAVNLPHSKVILVNRERWNAISDLRLREAIALHEILSLMKIESTGKYNISANYLRFQGGSDGVLIAAVLVNQIEQIKSLDTRATKEKIMNKFFSQNDCSTESANWRGYIKEILRKKIYESNSLTTIDSLSEQVEELRLVERHCMRMNISIIDGTN